jgi:type III pantothenate kinase
VDEVGTVQGASIAPGLRTASRALSSSTAQLPEIEPTTPTRAIGTDTHSALQSALGFGYRGFVGEILRRMREELGGAATVYATGGLVEPIANHIDAIDEIDPWLTLDGLQILADYRGGS